MTALSPAAQAVYVAFEDATTPEAALAAALRAAADQVVYNRVCHMELRLLADELEGK
jgi:hypothetical protein